MWRRFVLMWLAWRHHGNHSTNINSRNYISSKAQPPAGSDSTDYLDVVEGIICHLIPEQEFRWSLELEISVLYGPASSDQEFFAFIRCYNSAYISAFTLRGPRHLSVLGQSTPRRLDGTSPN